MNISLLVLAVALFDTNSEVIPTGWSAGSCCKLLHGLWMDGNSEHRGCLIELLFASVYSCRYSPLQLKKRYALLYAAPAWSCISKSGT